MEMGPYSLIVHAVTAPCGQLVLCRGCRLTSQGVIGFPAIAHLGPGDVAHIVLVMHGCGGRVGGQRQRLVVDEAGAPLLALRPLPHLGVALAVLLSPLRDPHLPVQRIVRLAVRLAVRLCMARSMSRSSARSGARMRSPGCQTSCQTPSTAPSTAEQSRAVCRTAGGLAAQSVTLRGDSLTDLPGFDAAALP